MLDSILHKIRGMIPATIFAFFQPAYHISLAWLGALWYGFPSRKIKVIAVTGTKGKSSTTEILSAMLEAAGHKTALINTIRFKIGDKSKPNLYKMSMPGRGVLQRLLRQAADAGCTYAIMEMTSQGALLYRHRFISLDTLIFTNLSPEHIEAHGSYEQYREAKLAIAAELARSTKPRRSLIANGDDAAAKYFLAYDADKKIEYHLRDVEPITKDSKGLTLTIGGNPVHSPLSGEFNAYNILAAMTSAKNEGVGEADLIRAVQDLAVIPGRVQKIDIGYDVNVIVDYAHTPDSLEKLYRVFEGQNNICVLGGTGGGRDTWKRSAMGALADRYCSEIILTDEDPYDEDPHKIVRDVADGIKQHKPIIVMDRRRAISEALKRAIKVASPADNVLITGKGTDPYIMGPHDTKTPWSDADVVREEAAKIFNF